MGFIRKDEKFFRKLFGHYPKSKLKRFWEFHRRNPEVFTRFVELAEEMRGTGRKKYSAEAIINVLRWEHDLKTEGDFFKINDHYRSLYVRLLIYRKPEFLGFFTLKNYQGE